MGRPRTAWSLTVRIIAAVAGVVLLLGSITTLARLAPTVLDPFLGPARIEIPEAGFAVTLPRSWQHASPTGCRRLWLVTTNDNVPVIGFYQRWGMDLVAFRRDAVTEARANLKPEIPQIGNDDIPIRHELEFEVEP